MALLPGKLALLVSLIMVASSHRQQARTDRQLSSFSCPRLRRNTPELLSDLTSTKADSGRLANIYSTGVDSRTTLTAQQFYSGRQSNGKVQFIPPVHQDIGDACIKNEPCNNASEFRSIDGSCNNIRFPQWGQAGAPLVRILPAFYADGKRSVRKPNDTTRESLPGTRLLHTEVLNVTSQPDPALTYAVVTWGQLVSHDTARILDAHTSGKESCLCCTRIHEQLPPAFLSKNCLPLVVQESDPFYSEFEVTCLNFMRSATTDDKNCIITPVQLMSDVTHYVDTSYLYGSNDNTARRLRTLRRGMMKWQTINGEQFLPHLDRRRQSCPKNEVCYDTGDDRVNQNPMLTALQTMILRLHNLVAAKLSKMNSHWGDDKLYQESRKVVSGVVQHITYSEYLPAIIDKQVLMDSKLIGPPGLVSDQYDKVLNAGTLVSFTSAAFRAFHAMIPSDLRLFNENRELVDVINLSNVYFKPKAIQEKGSFDNFVRGLTFQPSQQMSRGYVDEVGNLLFRSGQTFGLDLVAADIMRGRDHGLPSYNQARLSCGLPQIPDFAGLHKVMPSEVIGSLTHLYSTVHDVDLYVGALLERKAPGSLVGPVFQCIIVEQFRRWKDGDRYFYTFTNNGGSFTADQLSEVEKITLAKLVCLTTKVENMQTRAFLQPDQQENKLMPCSSLTQMDFEPWHD